MDLELNRGQANPEVLFISRANHVAVTAQSVYFYPFGVRQYFVGSNADPEVTFADPLPGVANSFNGPDPQKWLTGIPRFGSAHLSEIYPGIDARYVLVPGRGFILKLILRPGTDPKLIAFELANTSVRALGRDGSMTVPLGPTRYSPNMTFPLPVAFQVTPLRRLSRTARFVLHSATRFGFEVDGVDARLPLQIEMTIPGPPQWTGDLPTPRYITDPAGDQFIAATIADAAGHEAPFPESGGEGCWKEIETPYACTDVAVYKFSPEGELIFASYLVGRTQELVAFAQFARDGDLILAGNTDSSDFPVMAGALQPEYGGPEPEYRRGTSSAAGDFFAVKIDIRDGRLRSATYLGGPDRDRIGEAALGTDGSLYFMPIQSGDESAGMPVTPGALQGDCAGDPCSSAYAAHLSPELDRLLYGTYLPGFVQADAQLHSDGSMYVAGSARFGFPTTPGAYQRQPAGERDGMVARLDSSGSTLIFGTFLGTSKDDWILNMAVAPDASVWVVLSSFVQCCIDIEYRVVRLDSRGERILADVPIQVHDLAVDPDGNLLAIASGKFPVSPDAFLANSCGDDIAYIKLDPNGELLFATYLPGGASSGFGGTSENGLPILYTDTGVGPAELIEGQSMGIYAGCVVDAAGLGNSGVLSPGAIVTLFGSQMGPLDAVGFQLEHGRVPTTLGGTRVLLNGEPIPLLLVSYWQINAIIPYSVPLLTAPTIQVESHHEAGNVLAASIVLPALVSLFRLDDSPMRPAAAVNEDGTLNSPQNPAKPGWRVALFGTGGGATIPPSVAGEVTPLELRVLENIPPVTIVDGTPLTVEFAGAAPGLVTGVTQINIKLRDPIPEIEGYPRGTLPLFTAPGYAYSTTVTIAVSPE